MRVVTTGCLTLSFFVCGCAGPMTPFGAIHGFAPKAKLLLERILPGRDQEARVRFYPRRQVLHTAGKFSIEIEDAKGIPKDFKLTLIYNGEDVSRQFLARAERVYADGDTKLVLTSKSLRLPAGRQNDISVSYQRDRDSNTVISRLDPPTCSAFAVRQELADTGQFKPPARVIASINRYSGQRNLNPYFVAGLIAQESAFDPRAISRSKALGLTQITSLGEGEVVKKFTDWPRHPDLENMSVPALRMAILRGKINARNEWRLDPERSVEGGIEYLSYLSDYWSKPDKRLQLVKHLDIDDEVLSEVMLASYNSGASRVSEAIDRRGRDWLQDEELGEARKYVRRVNSYCDHFMNGEE